MAYENNYVVTFLENKNKTSVESLFKNEDIAIDRAIFLKENKNIDLLVYKVDDLALANYLLNYRIDDAFLKKELIFDTTLDMEFIDNKIDATPQITGLFENEAMYIIKELSKEYNNSFTLPSDITKEHLDVFLLFENNKEQKGELELCQCSEVGILEISEAEFIKNYNKNNSYALYDKNKQLFSEKKEEPSSSRKAFINR